MSLFGEIPHGKEDCPVLVPMRAPEYNIDDVDGAEYMLDHRMEGCACFFCSKEIGSMDEAKASLEDGRAVKLVSGKCQVGPFTETVVGACIQPLLTEYDRDYRLHIEGIADVDGNRMAPMDYVIHAQPKSLADPLYQERDGVTLEVAREGMVLLKNEGNILPLGKDASINVFGSGFAKFRLGASGAGRINPRYNIRLFDGLETCSTLRVNEELRDYYATARNTLPEKDVLERARAFSGTAVIALTRGTSENFDNLAFAGEFYLTEEEESLIREVSRIFKDTVLLLNTGYPIDVRYVEKYKIKALLWTGLCGMSGGRAVAEILEGTVNPSGKLPDTWSLTWEEIPSSRNFYQPVCPEERINGGFGKYIDTVYEEGLYVGYRYFDTFDRPVAYGFGHGLSYTRFSMEFRVERWIAAESLDETALVVKAVVTNRGERAGKEVVQLYMQIPDGRLEQPKRRLVGFAKTGLLSSGESQELELIVKGRELASFDVTKAAWICEPGEWKLYAGHSLEESQVIETRIMEEEKLLSQSCNYMPLPPEYELQLLSKKEPEASYPQGKKSGITGSNGLCRKGIQNYRPGEKRQPSAGHHGADTENMEGSRTASVAHSASEQKITWDMVKTDESLLEAFVEQLSTWELARMAVCAKNGWNMEARGEAGFLYVLEEYGTPEFVFADGNNGVNLNDKNIGFPTSVTVCATFNEDLAYRTGAAIAEEAKEKGMNVILAPAANLHRNPLGGRNAEYFSEDPLLAGRMAGRHGQGLEEHGIVSCMKHLAANNCESARLRNDSIIDERTLRELYLKVFEEAFQIYEPSTLMTAYNAVNSVYCAENADMLEGIFEEEFGFDGFVMTDWTSCDTCDIVNAVAAGNGWITPGGMDDTQTRQLAEGVENGRIDRARLKKSIYRMFRVVLRFSRK